MQGEKALEDHEFFGLQDVGCGGAGMGAEIVDRDIDGSAFTEFADMGDQQFVFEGGGFVEVGTCALFQGRCDRSR